MMNNKQRMKLGARVMWFNAVERWHDFVNILLPIFMVTGLLVACLRFWMWVFGVSF